MVLTYATSLEVGGSIPHLAVIVLKKKKKTQILMVRSQIDINLKFHGINL